MSCENNDIFNETAEEAKEEKTLAELLMEMQEANMKLLGTLSELLDKVQEQQQNFSDLNQYTDGIAKVIRDVNYYERHGSPTLPHNSKIDVTRNFNT